MHVIIKERVNKPEGRPSTPYLDSHRFFKKSKDLSGQDSQIGRVTKNRLYYTLELMGMQH